MLRIENLSVGPLTNIQFNVAEGSVCLFKAHQEAVKPACFRAVADLMPHKGEIWLRESCNPICRHGNGENRCSWFRQPVSGGFFPCGQHFLSRPDAETLQGLGLELP